MTRTSCGRKEKTSITISTHYFLFVGTSLVHLTIKTYVGLVKNTIHISEVCWRVEKGRR